MAGVISASDFIHVLRRLRSSVTASGNPMSEQEMDAHTIRWVVCAGVGVAGLCGRLCRERRSCMPSGVHACVC